MPVEIQEVNIFAVLALVIWRVEVDWETTACSVCFSVAGFWEID